MGSVEICLAARKRYGKRRGKLRTRSQEDKACMNTGQDEVGKACEPMRPTQTSDTRGGKTRSFNRGLQASTCEDTGNAPLVAFWEGSDLTVSQCRRNITQRDQLETRHHSFVVCNREGSHRP